jgi:hypothetical protein
MSARKTPEAALTLTEADYAKLLSDLGKLWATGKAKAQSAVSRQILQTYGKSVAESRKKC